MTPETEPTADAVFDRTAPDGQRFAPEPPANAHVAPVVADILLAHCRTLAVAAFVANEGRVRT